METVNNSNQNVFELVTKIAVLLSQNECVQAEQTSATEVAPAPASVAHQRTKIYESLLSPCFGDLPSPHLDKLPQYQKLLEGQFANLKSALGKDNMDICPSQKEHKEEQSKYNKKLLLPLPLRLQLDPGHGQLSQQYPLSPRLLRSIENMRDSIKPINFRPKSDIKLSDIEAMRASIKFQKKSNLACSVLKESLARMNETKNGARRDKINLPLRLKRSKGTVDDAKKSIMQSVKAEKHFLSDRIVSNELRWHQDPTKQLVFIELPQLVNHLKNAAAGLQSDTIVYADDGRLLLKPQITLSTVLPEVLVDFVEPFLATGMSYRRLSARTQWPHATNHIERPMNRKMRQAIIVFLANFRIYILSLSANSLSQLLRSAGPAMELVQQLDNMFHAERRLNFAEGLGGISGISLLSFVWSSFKMGINCEFSQLLMYLLRSLCETYFAQLQRWIYQGELEEPFNELFISRCPHKPLDERSKEFFDRGYYVRSDAVPGFLAGCEQVILQCGKYNCFLKAYNSQHMVFKLKYPDLIVCLSDQQLMAMRQELDIHLNRILQNIDPFTMQSTLEAHASSRQRFGNRMWDCTQTHIADWKVRQQNLQLKANAAKQQRYNELNKQRAEQEQIRLEHQRSELAFELAYHRNCDQLENRRLQEEKESLESQIAVLQKDTIAVEMKPVVVSPNDSTSSCRTFVSCEEPDLDELLPQSETPPASQSDILNSNKSPSDMARNRLRNNCSEQVQECQMEVQMCQSAASSAISYTETERNRMRVLNCTEEPTQRPPDMNMNLEDLTDLQRNRLRMQQHNKLDSVNSDDDAGSGTEKRALHTDSELARNRRRVMEGDFTISGGLGNALHLPLEPEKLFVAAPLDTATPMSTTSDVEVEFAVPNEVIDAKNNNSNIDVDIDITNSDCQHENGTDNNNSNTDIDIEVNCDSQHENETEQLALAAVAEPQNATVKERKSVFNLHNFQMQTSPSEGSGKTQIFGHNPFLIKRYMQLSVMIPLKAHLSLLRNEVLRIFQEKSIFEHFYQLRKYFFLLDGEFCTLLISGILDQIESGVEPHSLCQRGVLDSILDNAITSRASSDNDPVSENLTLNCTNIPETFDLMDINVLSIFTLDCKMDWPLNLVFSTETMEKYMQIFSYLVKLRHVNFIMERAYQHFHQSAKLHGRSLQQAPQYRHLQLVRHKLSHFVITLQNYLATNALEASWKSFTDDLIIVDSVEGLYQRHAEYLKEIAFFSLLNRRSVKFRETIDSILMIALRFCKILHSKQFVLNEEQQFVHPRYKRLVYEEGEFEKFIRYAIYLGNKVAGSGYQEKVVELIRIINYNNYYNVTESKN